MSLPEITALCRVFARSDASDSRQQARNLERLHELTGYLKPHADAGTAACLEATAVLMEHLAQGTRPDPRDLLDMSCRLMATVEKHWSGEDPDATIAKAIYDTAETISQAAAGPEPGAPAGPAQGGPRIIRSAIHGAKTTAFAGVDVEEAQRRIETLKRTPRINEMVLGELLVELGHVSAEDIRDVVEEQEETGMLLGQILQQRGLLSAEKIEETVKLQRQLRGQSTLESVLKTTSKKISGELNISLRGEAPGGASAPGGVQGLRERGNDSVLGAILVRQGAVSAAQVEQALARQRASGLRIGETLVEMGATTWQTIERAVELQKRLRHAAGVAAPRLPYR
jgi:hypothetical protein